MIDEVGGAVRNKAMQGLEKVRFYIQVLWEATEGNAVRETHNHRANGWRLDGLEEQAVRPVRRPLPWGSIPRARSKVKKHENSGREG